jgi:hypothetical protein
MRIEGAQLPGQSLLHPVDADRRLYFTSSIDWSFLAARRGRCGRRKYIYSFDRDLKELSALPDVDPKELASIREAMLEWRMNAELAMLARPPDGDDETGPWLRS